MEIDNMQNSKMRKMVAQAVHVGLNQATSSKDLDEVLAGCRNGRTRARLKSRIQKGA